MTYRRQCRADSTLRLNKEPRVALYCLRMLALLARAYLGAFQPCSKDYVLRWAAVAIIGLAVAFGLRQFGVAVAFEALRLRLLIVALLLAFAAVYSASSRLQPRAATRAAIVSDFLLCVVQFMAMSAVLLPLSYMAALPCFPLLDGQLAKLDALLFGLDWNTAARWVADHPTVEWLLKVAYYSGYFQIGAILLLGSSYRPGERNSEFIWHFLIGILLTNAIFVFTPALGKEGHLTYMATLIALRDGQWTVLDYADPEGIITFPSFHATAALLFVYAVRRRPWVLAAFIPLNILMIAATPPIGGHYFVDLLGGGVVAVATISATGVLRKHLLPVLMLQNRGQRYITTKPTAPAITRQSLFRRILAVEGWRIRHHGPLPYGAAIAAGGAFVLLQAGSH
jgi:PAP2 superfamily